MKYRPAGALVQVVLLVGLFLGAACASPPTQYPTRAIELVVPFPPGGVSDLTARSVAERLARKWGQPINVVNKPGGSGATGVLAVLQAPPDGYTMLTHAIGATLLPALQLEPAYSWDQPTAVGLVISNGLVFTVGPNSPWTSLEDVADALRREPLKYTYAVGGIAGPQVFAIAQFLREAGVDPGQVQRVVMQGSGPALTALAGGHVDFAAFNIPEATELVSAGRLRALAVTTANRSKQLSNVATAAEAGFPGVDQDSWNGISGPPNLPDFVVQKWDDGLRELSQDPSFVKTLEDLGGFADLRGAAEFKKLIQAEYERAVRVATDMGLKS